MSSSGRILIVDDEEVIRQIISWTLRKAGFDVTAATEGSEALRLLNSSTYDLVYLDIHMPEMNGLEILEEIRKRHPDFPVVLFTGEASLNTAIQAVRLGANDYLIKPVDPEILIARTRVILEERALEKRKREIQEHIESLQSELKGLEETGTGPLRAEPVPGERFLKLGSLILDLQVRRATFGDQVLNLPPTAFDYLLVLASHFPEVVQYQTLVTEAQGYQVSRYEAQDMVKWHIHVLRQSLEPDPKDPRHIINIRGTGYKLVVS